MWKCSAALSMAVYKDTACASMSGWASAAECVEQCWTTQYFAELYIVSRDWVVVNGTFFKVFWNPDSVKGDAWAIMHHCRALVSHKTACNIDLSSLIYRIYWPRLAGGGLNTEHRAHG